MIYCNSRFLALGVSVIVLDFYDGMSHIRLFAYWTFLIVRCFETNTSNKQILRKGVYLLFIFIIFINFKIPDYEQSRRSK